VNYARPFNGSGREDRREVQIVGDEDETVLMCPRQDLDVRRGRRTDGGPVDGLEPVARQPIDPVWATGSCPEQLHG